MQLQLKVVEMTQCWNPRVGGVLEWCWMKQLWIRHGDLALRVIQGLKTSRAKGLCMENMNGFYTNLENIYVPQNMILVVFGIVDENGAQAIKNGGGRVCLWEVLCKYTTQVSDEEEHMSIFSYINANGEIVLNFYIFEWKKFWGTTSKDVRREHAWLIVFLFGKWHDHFFAYV